MTGNLGWLIIRPDYWWVKENINSVHKPVWLHICCQIIYNELKSDTHGSLIKCGSPQQFYPPGVFRGNSQTQSRAPRDLNLKPSPKI